MTSTSGCRRARPARARSSRGIDSITRVEKVVVPTAAVCSLLPLSVQVSYVPSTGRSRTRMQSAACGITNGTCGPRTPLSVVGEDHDYYRGLSVLPVTLPRVCSQCGLAWWVTSTAHLGCHIRRPRTMSQLDLRSIDFARLVRNLREASGLTQEQFARQLGVTWGTVSGWENGRHRPLRVLARQLLRRASRAGVEPCTVLPGCRMGG